MTVLGARGNELCGQVTAAFANRGSLNEFWQETAENFYPERADFTGNTNIGEGFASGLYSSEPILARRDFGNYLGAAIRPKGRVWWKAKAMEDEINAITAVSGYLEKKSLATLGRMKDWRSQFIRSASAADHDYVTFGNSVTSVEEKPDRKGWFARTWHIRDCAWRENMDGEVDTLFRKTMPTIRQLVGQEKRGWNIHPKIRERLAKEPDTKVPVYHILMPAMDYDPNRRMPQGLEYVSAYVDFENKWLMWDKNVPVFNYAVSRWFTIDASPYGFSPAVISSFPDARSLQVMTWSIIEAGEKAVEPPMVAVEEVVQGGVDLRAGAVTWIDKRYDERTGEAIRAIEMGGNPQFGEVLRQGMTGNLREAWYLNKLFLPESGPQMTAQEVQRRHEEWLRVAQPIIEPAEPERNGRILEIIVQLEMSIGLWGDLKTMPEALRGRTVDYSYDNPLEDARKQSATNSFRAMTETTAMATQVYGPSIVKNVDHNKAFREAILGVAPPDWLVDEDEAAEAVQMEEDVATAGQAMQEVGAMAETEAAIQPKVAA